MSLKELIASDIKTIFLKDDLEFADALTIGTSSNDTVQTFGSLQSNLVDNNAGNADKNSVPAPQSTPSVNDAKISRDRAIEIALEKAKLKKADVRDLEAELDYEKGVLVWEVDFDYQNFDYSYDINADSGAIVFEEIEKDDR